MLAQVSSASKLTQSPSTAKPARLPVNSLLLQVVHPSSQKQPAAMSSASNSKETKKLLLWRDLVESCYIRTGQATVGHWAPEWASYSSGLPAAAAVVEVGCAALLTESKKLYKCLQFCLFQKITFGFWHIQLTIFYARYCSVRTH